MPALTTFGAVPSSQYPQKSPTLPGNEPYTIAPLYDEFSGKTYFCDIVQNPSFDDPRVIVEIRRHSGPLPRRQSEPIQYPQLLWGIVLEHLFPGEYVDCLHFVRWSVTGWVDLTAAVRSIDGKAAFLAGIVGVYFSGYNTSVLYLGCVRPDVHMPPPSLEGPYSWPYVPPTPFYTPNQPIVMESPATPQKRRNEVHFMGEVPLPPRELLPDFILAAQDANDQQGELVNTQDSNRTTDYNKSNTVHSNGSHDAKLLSSTSSWSAASFMDQQRQWKFHYERFLTSLLQRGISLANDAYDVLPVIKEEVRNMKSDLQGRCGAWLLSLLELRCACLLSTVAQIVNRGGPNEKVAEECSGALRLCARTAVKVIHSIDHVLPSLETLQEQEHTSGVSIRMIQFILLSLQLRCLRHLSLVTMVCGAVYLEETLFTAYSVLELATSTTEQCVVRLSGSACQQWSADLQGEVLMVSLSVLELLLTQSPQHYSERRCQLMGMVVSLLKRWRDHTRECRFPNCAEEVVLRLRKEVPTDFHAILDHLQRQTVSVVRGEAGRREKSVFHGYTITQLWSAAGVDLHFTKTKCLLHTLITLKPFFPADGWQTEQ